MSDGSEDRPWWIGYFDDVFLRIYEPFLSGDRTDSEVAALVELIGDRPRARVLDVACGWGRHSIALAAAGFDVTGVDLSEFLLAEARRRAAAAAAHVAFVHADIHDLPFKGEFDVALSLFSSLGYGDDAADVRALRSIRRALRNGGVFIMEAMNRDSIARDFIERDWWETPSGDTIRVERTFDAAAGTSDEILYWRDVRGNEGEKRHTLHIRTATEWTALLAQAGFRPVEWFGGWSLEPLTLRSGDLIVVAELID